MAYRANKSGLAKEQLIKRLATYPKDEEKRVIAWILDVLNEDMIETRTLKEWLHDGTILCKLMNEIQPGAIHYRHTKVTDDPWKQVENIGKFIEGAKKYGVNETNCFVTLDLHEGNDLAQVLSTINALDRKAHTKGWDGPILGSKEATINTREFTTEIKKQSECVIPAQMGTNTMANQSGMTAPGTKRQIY